MFYGFKLDLNRSFPSTAYLGNFDKPTFNEDDHFFSSFWIGKCLVGNFYGILGGSPGRPPFVGGDEAIIGEVITIKWVGGKPKEWHVGV